MQTATLDGSSKYRSKGEICNDELEIISQVRLCECSTNSSDEDGLKLQPSWPSPDDRRPFSPLGLEMDSESEDEDAPQPDGSARRVTEQSFPPLRKSLSSGALEEQFEQNAERLATFGRQPTPEPEVPVSKDDQRADSPTVGLERQASRRSQSDGLIKCPDGLPPPIPMKRTISSGSSNQEATHPFTTSTPERKTSPSSCHSRSWSFSPLTKSRRAPVPRTLKKSTFSKMVDFSSFKKLHQAATSTPWDRQSQGSDSNGIMTPSLVTDNSAEARDDKPTRYEFEAPRKGQLGLVIESDAITGPVVHAVKDYSPLLGLVEKGDRIVEVDGKSTARCTLTDMSRLLSTPKPPMMLPLAHNNGGNLKIAIERCRWSPPRQRHSRDESYGSSSLASSSRFDDAEQRTTILPRFTEYHNHPPAPHHKARGSF